MTMYPTFRYHPVLAPEGRKFTDDAAFEALGPEWVDTPTKFPGVGESAPAVSEGEPVVLPMRRGRKAKE